MAGYAKKIGTSVFNFNYDTTPLWYLYMLIGVYLFIPIIGVWLNTASAKDIRIFWPSGVYLLWHHISRWLLLCWDIQVIMIIQVFGVFVIGMNLELLLLFGFLGYIILAYYLVKYPLNWTWSKTLSVAIPLFIIGFAITFAGFLITQKYFPASYANLEIVWYFCNINVAMMTFAMFIVFQKSISKNPKY